MKDQEKHRRKIVAPVVITIIIAVYYGIVSFILIKLPFSPILKAVALAVPVIVVILLVFVARERVKEIKKGEEDDLSEY